MGLLRPALLNRPMLALAIGLAGLILRLTVPAGFMPVLHHGQISMALCSGYGAAASQAGMHDDRGVPATGGSCAFADLALPLVGGADPVQLLAAQLFIVAASLFFAAVPPRRAGLRLRPPLRGPPLPA